MRRREKSKPPRPDMRWSEKHGMWVEHDTRTRAERRRDAAVAARVQADRPRIDALLRRTRGKGEGVSRVDAAARNLARAVLRSLIRARESAGLSQVEVARRIGMPQPAIVRLEAGTHSPTLSTLARYASAIGARFEVRRPA